MSLGRAQQDQGRGIKKDNHNVGFFAAAQSANVAGNLGRMNQGARMGGFMNFGRGQGMGLQGVGQGPQNMMSSGGGPSRSSGLPSLFDVGSRNQPSLATQKRIDADRASNILATFGLSSRDLDELSRYPEEKLTPESLPDILMQLKRKRTDEGPSLNYSRGENSPREDRSFRPSRGDWEDERRFRSNFDGRDSDADPVVNYDHGSSRESNSRYYDRKDYEHERLRNDDFRRDEMRMSEPYKFDSDYGKMGPSPRGQERSLFERKRGSPSLSNINDYHGFMPSMFPHLCSLCDVTVHSVKDWHQHKNEPAHKRRCLLLLEIYPQWVPEDVPPPRNNPPGRQSNLAPDAASALLAAIRQLDALDGHGGNRKGFIENKRRNMKSGDDPGRVLHMTELPKGKCKVRDILKLAQPFGIITKYLLLNTKSEGFVEMATSDQAQTAVSFYSMKPAILYGKRVRVDMSQKYKEIDLKKQKQDRSGGRVALFQNLPPSGYSDADVVKMGAGFGKVLNYIIMRLRNQAFLEMESKKALMDMVKHYKKTPLIFRGRKVTVDASQKYKTLVLKKPSIKVQELLKEQDDLDNRKRRRSRSPSSKKKPVGKPKTCPKADGEKAEQKTSEDSPSNELDKTEGENETEEKCEEKEETTEEEAVAVIESDAELVEDLVEGLESGESENDEAICETVQKEEEPDIVGTDTVSKESTTKIDVASRVESTMETSQKVQNIQSSTRHQEATSQESKEECFPENIDEFVTVDEVGDVEAGILELEDLMSGGDYSKVANDEADTTVDSEKPEAGEQKDEASEQKDEDVDKPKRKRGRKKGKAVKAKKVEQTDKVKDDVEETDIEPAVNEKIEVKVDCDEKSDIKEVLVSACTEPEAKRARSRSPTPEEYRLGPYQLNNPIGLDYIVPKTGYYCTLCCLFYTKEEVAKKTHCSSLAHYQKLKKILDKQAEEYRKVKVEEDGKGQTEEQSEQ
ncbi:matrin-3 isoform X2 [Callorhinchus milii]|uniref:matrin-3 isoform X2 n=1 Tax=Callorhinchus milii TaxID=7868 RepID=UPI00045714F2|nr:matrin-3 isoform X2 [Callorhinchus milii]|eukprot:gi/632948321/ref/XP_007889542.1/ PREDICTED: matrin-3 isoform X2 [Callorhinchus milii]